MSRSIINSTRLITCVLLLGGFAYPTKGQIASGPYVRFMGNNYSNGLATSAGPASTATLHFSTTGSGSGIPVVAPSGKVVIVSTGGVACYSSAGSLIWSTTGSPNGAPAGDPAAIGSNNAVYVVQKQSSMFGTTSFLVAYDLNAAGPGASVLWTCQYSGGPGPAFAGSPVVGPDNTVYCVDSHSISAPPRVFAIKQGSSYNSVTNMKWWWDISSVDSSIYAGIWRTPILYTSGTTAYLVLSGTLSFGPTYMNYQTATIRTAIVKDLGTGGSYIGHYDFPYQNPTMMEPVPPHYANNGPPSLSPDGTKVIVAGYWLGGSPTYKYGVYCLDINVTGGTVGPASGWPAISSDVHTTVSTFDETNPANAYSLSGAMDSGNTYVYFVNAAGTSLSQRNLSNGNKNWSTTAGSVIGGQLPALDSNNAVWIGTNDGHVIRYNSSGSVVVSVSVVDPVNLLSTLGIGVAIGTSNYLYVTTTNSNTGVTNLRGVN